MAQSFKAAGSNGLSKKRSSGGKRQRVLVTGAAGNIGSYFAQHSNKKYDLRLMVRDEDEDVDAIRAFGEVVVGDLADLDGLKKFCRGIDAIVHMAGDPRPAATWDALLQANIIGTYNLFVAARAAGVKRVVYASSIHAISGYPADVQVKTSEPVNPGDLYGVSKCFGEALARYMAEQEGLSAVAIRIGAFQPIEAARDEGSVGMLDAFVSQRDLNHLIECCLDAENIKFAIAHGLSDNRFKRMDISDTRELLGYRPQDDLTEENPKLKKLRLSDTVHGHNVQDPGQKSGLRKQVRSARK